MPQLVFYNPHVDDFLAEPPHFKILRRRALKKYGHLLSEAANRDAKVLVFIDATVSVFVPKIFFNKLPRALRQVIAGLEFRLWIKRNGLKDRIERVRAPDAGMVLFGFSYKGAVGDMRERLVPFSQFKTCIFHLSHYFIATAEKAENLSRVPNVILAGDSDLIHNPYFKKFFGWYRKPVLIVPFAVAGRFQVRRAFSERSSKVVAMGTFHNLDEEKPDYLYSDFKSFFATNTYHPVRKEIFGRKNEFEFLESRISPFRPPASKGFFKRINVSQAKYFSIDIVDLYNQFKYAVIGEEASGFPALGAFEALACGCLYFGQPQYFDGLGLKAGVHYAGYNGTLEDLEIQFHALDNQPERAAQIASAGSVEVARFRAPVLYEKFLSDLHAL